MKFYFRILILCAAGQMQPRLARLIHLGHIPADHPVSTEWLSVDLKQAAESWWFHCCAGPRDGAGARRTCGTFLLKDFFPWVRAGPVAEVMES